MTHTAAVIGTGPEPENPVWGESAAMAYQHAPGYERRDDVELAACADLVRENALAFADEFDISEDHVFEDYEEMLREVEPDVVSVCTPVPTHAPIVLDCIHSGVPDAVHCEKPMATRWEDARLMAQEADRWDVQLTFNHQRRFEPRWRRPKELLDDGEIGDLKRLEVSAKTLLDNATHFIDLANFYNDERPAEWVLGQLDYREEHVKYGAHNANQTLALWGYPNGVEGMAITGHGTETVGASNRLVGTEGVIEVNPTDADAAARIRRAGDEEWTALDVETEAGWGGSIVAAIDHVVDCLDAGEEPELSARRALNVTELIFGTYESSRRRGRVDLPLRTDGNALEEMVESGELNPRTPEDNS
ncbi:MAG: Gfo/Idh/MocA family protein [Halobacteriaceae archaeon]